MCHVPHTATENCLLALQTRYIYVKTKYQLPRDHSSRVSLSAITSEITKFFFLFFFGKSEITKFKFHIVEIGMHVRTDVLYLIFIRKFYNIYFSV